MAQYSNCFTQGLNANCELVNPTDTTGVKYEWIDYTPSANFPNWHRKPFDLHGSLRYGPAFGNKMEIVLNDAIFQNYYTTHAGDPYNALNGIDTKSMKEFAKEKYRKDVLEIFLKDKVPCNNSSDYYVFSFITKKECFKERICRFQLNEEIACCSDSILPYNINPTENDHIEIINNIKYLSVKRKISCNEFSCCEERYHYICDPNDPDPKNTWVLNYKDYTPYVGKECSPQVINNPNCPMNYPSTCKSGCGSN